MFAQPRRGRAWRGCPKPRRRSWLRKQSAQALQTAIKTRVVSTGRRGGPSRTTVLLVKLPSGGFGPSNAKIAGLPAHKIVSFADRFPQRRTGAVKEALHPGV